MSKDGSDLIIFAFSPLFSFFFHLYPFFPSLFSFPILTFWRGGAIASQNLGGARASFDPPPPEYAPAITGTILVHIVCSDALSYFALNILG